MPLFHQIHSLKEVTRPRKDLQSILTIIITHTNMTMTAITLMNMAMLMTTKAAIVMHITMITK